MIEDPFYLAAGLVLLALGATLLFTHWRHGSAVALAVYMIGLGIPYAGLGGFAVTARVTWASSFAAAGGLAAVALLVPRPLTGPGRRDAWWAGAYGFAAAIVLARFERDTGFSVLGRVPGVAGIDALLIQASFMAVAVVSIALTVLLPLRARRLVAGEERTMRSLGIIAAAMILLSPGGPFPAVVAAARGQIHMAQGVTMAVTFLAFTALWLPATTGPHAARAKNILLTLIALIIGLAALHQVTGERVVQIGRLTSASFLAYTVLAGHIEGLETKLRFAISRSTIAAVFIAVFFVASEGAQIVLGQGNEWVGLFAAGALVFVLAPLQRAAERLAEKAVPVATPSGASAGSDNEDLYLRATGLALRDRVIAPEEELDLIELAERLGIGARRAAELRMAAGRGSVVRRLKTAGAISRSRTGRGGQDP